MAFSSGAAADSDDEWDEILLDCSLPHRHQHQHQQGEELTITIDDEPDDSHDRLVDFLERELLGEDEPMGDGDEDVEEEMEEEAVVSGHFLFVAREHGSHVDESVFCAGGEAAVEDDDDYYSSSENSERTNKFFHANVKAV